MSYDTGYNAHYNRFQNDTNKMDNINFTNSQQSFQLNSNPSVYKWCKYFQDNVGFTINSNMLNLFSGC